MRGKDFYAVQLGVSYGITPACAGKSHSIFAKKVVVRDHPRVCGEKLFKASEITGYLGSPPRVRGKAVDFLGGLEVVGITPACAGKRIGKAQRRMRAGDHPRVCGEKRYDWGDVLLISGSPPRVRGKVQRMMHK